MAYNRVYNDVTKQVLYSTREGLGDAIDWMMARAIELAAYGEDNVVTEEVQEDGEVTGWWTIGDIFDCNSDGWELPDGTLVKRGDDNAETSNV